MAKMPSNDQICPRIQPWDDFGESFGGPGYASVLRIGSLAGGFRACANANGRGPKTKRAIGLPMRLVVKPVRRMATHIALGSNRYHQPNGRRSFHHRREGSHKGRVAKRLGQQKDGPRKKERPWTKERPKISRRRLTKRAVQSTEQFTEPHSHRRCKGPWPHPTPQGKPRKASPAKANRARSGPCRTSPCPTDQCQKRKISRDASE